MKTRTFLSLHYDSVEEMDRAIEEFASNLESQGYEIEISTQFSPLIVPDGVRPAQQAVTLARKKPSKEPPLTVLPVVLVRVSGFGDDNGDLDDLLPLAEDDPEREGQT